MIQARIVVIVAIVVEIIDSGRPFYLAGSDARDLSDGSRASHDGEGAGGGRSDASQLAKSGAGNKAHDVRIKINEEKVGKEEWREVRSWRNIRWVSKV